MLQLLIKSVIVFILFSVAKITSKLGLFTCILYTRYSKPPNLVVEVTLTLNINTVLIKSFKNAISIPLEREKLVFQ